VVRDDQPANLVIRILIRNLIGRSAVTEVTQLNQWDLAKFWNRVMGYTDLAGPENKALCMDLSWSARGQLMSSHIYKKILDRLSTNYAVSVSIKKSGQAVH